MAIELEAISLMRSMKRVKMNTSGDHTNITCNVSTTALCIHTVTFFYDIVGRQGWELYIRTLFSPLTGSENNQQYYTQICFILEILWKNNYFYSTAKNSKNTIHSFPKPVNLHTNNSYSCSLRGLLLCSRNSFNTWEPSCIWKLKRTDVQCTLSKYRNIYTVSATMHLMHCIVSKQYRRQSRLINTCPRHVFTRSVMRPAFQPNVWTNWCPNIFWTTVNACICSCKYTSY